MHVAFDVGMHNKRLAVFSAPRGSPAAVTEAVRTQRDDASLAEDKMTASSEGTARRGAQVRQLWRAGLCWAWLPLAYLVLIASDWVGPPRTHGSKLALGIVVGGPSVLLLLQVREERLPCLLAVVLAHLVVTLSFVADARRFERDVIADTTMAALAGTLVTYAVIARPADMTACVLAAGAGLYVGALATVMLLQRAGAVDRMTLLTLQELYVFTTLLLAGLLARSAHG